MLRLRQRVPGAFNNSFINGVFPNRENRRAACANACVVVADDEDMHVIPLGGTPDRKATLWTSGLLPHGNMSWRCARSAAQRTLMTKNDCRLALRLHLKQSMENGDNTAAVAASVCVNCLRNRLMTRQAFRFFKRLAFKVSLHIHFMTQSFNQTGLLHCLVEMLWFFNQKRSYLLCICVTHR